MYKTAKLAAAQKVLQELKDLENELIISSQDFLYRLFKKVEWELAAYAYENRALRLYIFSCKEGKITNGLGTEKHLETLSGAEVVKLKKAYFELKNELEIEAKAQIENFIR